MGGTGGMVGEIWRCVNRFLFWWVVHRQPDWVPNFVPCLGGLSGMSPFLKPLSLQAFWAKKVVLGSGPKMPVDLPQKTCA